MAERAYHVETSDYLCMPGFEFDCRIFGDGVDHAARCVLVFSIVSSNAGAMKWIQQSPPTCPSRSFNPRTTSLDVIRQPYYLSLGAQVVTRSMLVPSLCIPHRPSPVVLLQCAEWKRGGGERGGGKGSERLRALLAIGISCSRTRLSKRILYNRHVDLRHLGKQAARAPPWSDSCVGRLLAAARHRLSRPRAHRSRGSAWVRGKSSSRTG